jgi:hypothetical protein
MSDQELIENGNEKYEEQPVTRAETRPETRPADWQRRPRSLFFPVVLIVLGVLFLLRNTGVIGGDVWGLVLRLWPLILILIGLDSLVQRQGLAGSLFWISLGGVFLLHTLGVLNVNVWAVIFNLWPLLLIAVGLDIVLGRRSLVGSILASGLMLALLAGSLWFLAFGRVSAAQYMDVTHRLETARQGRVELNPGLGSLRLGALSQPDTFVQGLVFQHRGETLQPSYREADGVAHYSLAAEGFSMVGSVTGAERWGWDLGLTPAIPLSLNINLGVGEALLDLRDLQIQDLTLDLGVGSTTVYLGDQPGGRVRVKGGIGQTVLVIPRGAAVSLRLTSGLGAASLPDTYIQQGGESYISPAYSGASPEQALSLEVDQGIGQLVVREE